MGCENSWNDVEICATSSVNVDILKFIGSTSTDICKSLIQSEVTLST